MTAAAVSSTLVWLASSPISVSSNSIRGEVRLLSKTAISKLRREVEDSAKQTYEGACDSITGGCSRTFEGSSIPSKMEELTKSLSTAVLNKATESIKAAA